MQQYRKHLWSPDMEATYLSRSISKMLESEEPVGDPFGGAAYGRYEGGLKSLKKAVKGAVGDIVKPIANVVGEDGIKVLALAAAVFTGGASLTALSAGSIAAGVAYAGATLSLVGTATGNERLSKIGNTVALVGGVAAVASGGLAALEKPMNDAINSAKQYYSQFVGGNAVSTGSLTAGQTGAVNVADDAAGTLLKEAGEDAVENAVVQSASGGVPAVENTGAGINRGVNDLSGAAGSGRPDSLGAFASKSSVPSTEFGLTTGSGTPGISPSFNPAPATSASSNSGLVNRALQFATDNPTIAFMAGNTAVSAIGGAAEASAKEDSENRARQQALDDRQFYNDSINGYNLQYDYSNVQSPYANPPQQLNQFQPPPQLVYDPQQQRYVPVSQPKQQAGLIANNMQRTA